MTNFKVGDTVVRKPNNIRVGSGWYHACKQLGIGTETKVKVSKVYTISGVLCIKVSTMEGQPIICAGYSWDSSYFNLIDDHLVMVIDCGDDDGL